MDRVVKIILDAMHDVLEIEQDEMADMLDANLFELHLLDSLSAVIVIQRIEVTLNTTINLRNLSPADISSVNSLAAVLESLIGQI